MEAIIVYWGMYNGDNGKDNGNYSSTLGLYHGDNGKENENYHIMV